MDYFRVYLIRVNNFEDFLNSKNFKFFRRYYCRRFYIRRNIFEDVNDVKIFVEDFTKRQIPRFEDLIFEDITRAQKYRQNTDLND